MLSALLLMLCNMVLKNIEEEKVNPKQISISANLYGQSYLIEFYKITRNAALLLKNIDIERNCLLNALSCQCFLWIIWTRNKYHLSLIYQIYIYEIYLYIHSLVEIFFFCRISVLLSLISDQYSGFNNLSYVVIKYC